jgi:thymidylate kinase
VNQLPAHSKLRILQSVIAVVGCDGSGKSSLTTDLNNLLGETRPTRLLYLGQSSGNIGAWIKALPLIGTPAGRYLARKAESSHDKTTKTTDKATALAIFCLSLWRAYKFRRMLSLNNRGVVVVTDRYPQAQISGFYYDGTGLGAVKTNSWLVRKLAAVEFRLYQWMANHVPALVIRLNVDADTAHARKPDHKLSVLKDKVTVIPNLRFNGAQVLDLNGCAPYQEVLSTALQAAGNAIKKQQP